MEQVENYEGIMLIRVAAYIANGRVMVGEVAGL